METLRGYLTKNDYKVIEGVEIAQADEAEYIKRFEQAEIYIDMILGYHTKAHPHEYRDTARAGTDSTIQLSVKDAGAYQRVNQLNYTVVEILEGTGAGQIRAIKSSNTDGVATVHKDWETAPDATSYYHIYQLGKFPRSRDRRHDPDNNRAIITVPRQLKEAVAAQVTFMTEMGDDYFNTDENAMASERIGNYSYNRGGGSGQSNTVGMIAPRAKQVLTSSGLINRTGRITNTDALQL